MGKGKIMLNDSGLVLRSRGRRNALKMARSGLRALLWQVIDNSVSGVECVRLSRVDGMRVRRENSIFDGVDRSSKIASGGDIIGHVLGWFDAMGGRGGGLSWRRTDELRRGHGECCKMEKV